jgi:hypothetical protein
MSREEGLNEQGEAPPPYIPKPAEEREQRENSGAGVPAVPLQTISREHAGLKPPDYSEASTESYSGPGQSSTGTGVHQRTANP